MKIKKFKPDWKIPPGFFIQEYIEFFNISKEEFSKLINLSLEDLEKFLIGDLFLTEDLINKICSVLDCNKDIFDIKNKQFYLTLEKNFRK